MPKGPKTDIQVLRALLSLAPGKLSTSEKTAFQEMWDKVQTGLILRLSKAQRAWTDAVYDKHKLDEERPPVRNIPVRDKSLISRQLDSMPRPLKPPGRA